MGGRVGVCWTAFALLGVATLLRLPGIGRPEVGDEGFALAASEQSVAWIADALVTRDAHPPAYFLLLRFWATLGHARWWLRLLSVGLGAGACLLIFHAGTDLFGAQIGRHAFLFAACSPLLIGISQVLRPYALAVVLSVGLVWAAGKLIRAPDDRAFTRRLTLATLFQVLLLYTYYPSAFVLIGVNGWVCWRLRRGPHRRVLLWVASLAGVAVAYLPWLRCYAMQMDRVFAGASSSTPLMKQAGIGFFIGPVQVGALAKALVALLHFDDVYATTLRFSAHGPTSVLAALALVGVGGVLAMLWIGWRGLQRAERIPACASLVLLVAVAPPICAAAMSAAGDLGLLRPIAVNLRYFGQSAAMATLLLAGAISTATSRRVSSCAAWAVCVGLLVQVPYLYRYPFNEQTRILSALDPMRGATLVISSPGLDGYFDRTRRALFEERFEHLVLSSAHLEAVKNAIADRERFYLVSIMTAERLAQGAPTERAFERFVEDHGYLKLREQRLSDLLSVVLYGRRESAPPATAH